MPDQSDDNQDPAFFALILASANGLRIDKEIGSRSL